MDVAVFDDDGAVGDQAPVLEQVEHDLELPVS
jgi:hypothetical protein